MWSIYAKYFFQNMWRNMFWNSSPKDKCKVTQHDVYYKICILEDLLKASQLLKRLRFWDLWKCMWSDWNYTCCRIYWPRLTPCLLSQLPFFYCAILTYHTPSFNDVLAVIMLMVSLVLLRLPLVLMMLPLVLMAPLFLMTPLFLTPLVLNS